MSIFSDLISKLLLNYKMILKRHLPAVKAKMKVIELGLMRKSLQNSGDVELYQKAKSTLADLNQWLDSINDLPSWYSGLEEFRQHLQGNLNAYRIQGDRVIHIHQKTSAFIVQAVQLMNLTDEQLNAQISQKMQNIAIGIAEYGTPEQRQYFLHILRQKADHNPGFFLPQISAFENHCYPAG